MFCDIIHQLYIYIACIIAEQYMQEGGLQVFIVEGKHRK